MNGIINRLVDFGQQAVEAPLDPKRSCRETPNYRMLNSLKTGGNGGPLDRVGEEMRASQFLTGSIPKRTVKEV